MRHGGGADELGRVRINRQPDADLDARPTSVIGGEADMVGTSVCPLSALVVEDVERLAELVHTATGE